MQIFRDGNGLLFEAWQLEGPTCLNTVNGEICGEPGMWAVYRPFPEDQGKPVLVRNEDFNFVPVN